MIIVIVVMALTLIRLTLAKVKDAWARTVSETCDTVSFVLILAFLLIRPFVAQAFYIPSESMERTLLVHDRLIVDKFSYRLHEPRRGDVVVFEAPAAATDENREGIDFIKRLIAVPGDTIQVRAAKLIVDGQPVDPQREGLPDIHSYLRYRLGIDERESVKIYPDRIVVGGKETVTTAQLADQLGRPGAKVVLTPGQTIRNGEVLDEPYAREDPDYNYPDDGRPLRLEDKQFFMMGDNRNRSRDSHAWGPLERRRVIGRAVVVFWPPSRMGLIR